MASDFSKLLARVQNLILIECKLPNEGGNLVDAILEQRNALTLTLIDSLATLHLQRLLQSLSLMDDCNLWVKNLELYDKSLHVELVTRVPLQGLTLKLPSSLTRTWISLTENRNNPSGPKRFKLILYEEMDRTKCSLVGTLCRGSPDLSFPKIHQSVQ